MRPCLLRVAGRRALLLIQAMRCSGFCLRGRLLFFPRGRVVLLLLRLLLRLLLADAACVAGGVWGVNTRAGKGTAIRWYVNTRAGEGTAMGWHVNTRACLCAE